MVGFHQVPAFNTWATVKSFIKRRYGAISRVFLALRGRTGKGLPESRHDRDIVVRSQKETENFLMLRPAGKNNRSHHRRCGVVMARENLTVPLDLTVSQCDCACIWYGRYSEALEPRSRGDPAPSPRKPGRRGKTTHAKP